MPLKTRGAAEIVPTDFAQTQHFFGSSVQTLNLTKMAEAAHRAWNEKFKNRRHLELKRDDEPLFKPIPNRELGRTSLSEIHVTDLEGIPLALKRTFPRKKVSDFERNELKLLRQWSKDKHKHIVSLIGSFEYTEKRHGGSFDLYLLIWPVAQCDLAAYLESIDSLAKWLKDNTNTTSVDRPELNQIASAIHQLAAIVPDSRRTPVVTSPRHVSALCMKASGHLQKSLGCMAEAVAWLHNRDIRHKDLKPSQFLLSREGLWLTDFGWSKDMSLEEHSVTEGFDQITRKYHSPERASQKPCGKPEDVFSLGCTFLEMIYRLGQPWVETISMPGFHQEGWSFHEHLEDLPTWMNEILATKDPVREHAAQIIVRMLETTPNHRPTVMDVVDHLSTGGWTTPLTHNFFSTCCHSRCTPHVAPSLPDYTAQPRINTVAAKSTKQSSSFQSHMPLNTSKDDMVSSWGSDRVPGLVIGPTGQDQNRSGLVRSNTGPFSNRSRTNPISPSNLSAISSTDATLGLEFGDVHTESSKDTSVQSSGATRRAEAQLPEQTFSNILSLQQDIAKNRHVTYVPNAQWRQSSRILAYNSSDPPDWSKNLDGDFWCAIDGCSARFREKLKFALHSVQEHPKEPLSTLETHDIAKDLIKTASPRGGLYCDSGLCLSSYEGHYREQSLVSHKKRKHGLLIYIHGSQIKLYR